MAERKRRAPMFAIFSGEHRAFWRPSGCGYTADADMAGTWYHHQAVRMTRICGPEKLISVVEVRRG